MIQRKRKRRVCYRERQNRKECYAEREKERDREDVI